MTTNKIQYETSKVVVNPLKKNLWLLTLIMTNSGHSIKLLHESNSPSSSIKIEKVDCFG